MNSFKYLMLVYLFVMISNKIHSQSLFKEQAFDKIDNIISALESVHVDPYKYCDKEIFSDAVSVVKSRISDSISIYKFCKEMQGCISKLQDGHTQLFYPNKEWNKYKAVQNGKFPFTIKVDKQIVRVDSVFEDHTEIRANDELLSINGINIHELYLKEKNYISAESQTCLNSRFEESFERILFEYGIKGDEIDVKILRDTKIFNTRVHRTELNSIYTESNNQYYTFSIQNNVGVLEMKIMYDQGIRFSKFLKKSINEMKKKNIEHFIIDFRDNIGGDSRLGNEICKWLCDYPFYDSELIKVKKSSEMVQFYKQYFGKFKYFFIKQLLPYLKIDNGTIYEIERYPKNPYKYRYTGEVILLTSNKTYSSADMFCRIYKHNKLGVIIGEETGGKGIDFGDIIQVKIPDTDILFDISCKEFVDVGDNKAEGVQPDIVIESELAFKEAMRYIRNK